MYDVIIIGAGLSGLYTAQLLQNVGTKVLVVEARDRPGGRTFTEKGIDLGGQWVGSSHKRVLNLLKKFGLETYPQYHEGKHISNFDDNISYYSSNISESNDDKSLQEIIAKLDKLSQNFQEKYDDISAISWLRENCSNKKVSKMIEWLFKVCTCVESNEVSVYFWLSFLKKCGGYHSLSDIEGGAQELRVKGGTMQISQKLAKNLEILWNTPVTSVYQTDSFCMVNKTRHLVSRYIINTVPLQLNKKIKYVPELHPAKTLAIENVKMGSVIKIVIEYPEPFWRNNGFSGEIMSNEEPIFLAYDASTPEKWALVAFICGNEVQKYQEMDIEKRKDKILTSFRKYFNSSKAYFPMEYHEKDWTKDEWSGGCYFAVPKIGFLSRMENEFKRPSGRIFWAGTETADEWIGYMEGALQSAERVSGEILKCEKSSKL